MQKSADEYQRLLEHFRFAAHTAKFGIWEYDFRTKSLFWDKSIYSLYGVEPDDYQDKNEILEQILHPDDLAPTIAELNKAIASENKYRGNFRIITPFSELRYFESYAVVLRESDGKAIKMLGIVRDISERIIVDNELSNTREINLKAQEIAGVGGWEYDVVNKELSWTYLTYQIHELPEDYQPNVDSAIKFYAPEAQPVIRNAVERALQKGDGWDLELPFITAKGNRRWVRAIGEAHTHNNQVTKLTGTFQDITERIHTLESLKNTLTELKDSENIQKQLLIDSEIDRSRLTSLLSAMNTGILFEDKNNNVEFVNSAFRKIWGIDEAEELIGIKTKQLLNKSTSYLARPDNSSRYLLKILNTHEISEKYEIELKDGRIITQLTYPVVDKYDTILGRLWLYDDITQERQTAEQLLYLAERDPLTGLYNRSRFQGHLDNLISNARRNHSTFALLYFDLDEFKSINDSYGHGTGDTVLVRTANEVLKMVRAEEILARLGGDEFALLTALNPLDNISSLASRIIKAVSSIPFRFRGKNIQLTTSIGIAMYPDHGHSVEDLVSHADSAMYMSKKQGKNTWSIYDYSLDSSQIMVDRLSWNQKIAKAIEEELLVIHYQGIYDTSKKELQYIEALVRMINTQDANDLIMPGQFIPVAEKSGLIIQLDTWIINKCLELLASDPSIPAIAINISGRTISKRDFPDIINQQLKKHKVDPRRLIIEITETAAISDIQEANHFIDSLHKFNCQICLDDFGSGFATFSYLKHLDIDTLKIDGNFIRDLSKSKENQAFVKAMVDIADGLGKKCIVEFVENEETLSLVRQMGVKYAQGYYLGRPSPGIPF